ncbi:MAG: hypothetical protein CMF45_08345 [Legionellales bacterium]|nr:hypothetical protein [Legionellales bacterium]|tara:strand:+ start:5120 stop:5950 length:831 start_codon:yes stop_codon:yes gene_type:complete
MRTKVDCKKPEISVILTFHNRPDMVKRAIQHIINQSINCYELILVDDFSATAISLSDINFGDIALTHIRNEVNLGANQSRLIGLRLAKGKYICFHDDDDYWMEEKLEIQLNYLNKNPNVHVVSCYARTNSKILKFPSEPSSLALSIHNCVGSFSIPMIRNTNLLESFLNNDLTNAQDWHVWRSLKKHYLISTVPKVLVFFDDGQHDRISSAKNIDAYYSSYLRVALIDTVDILLRAYHYSLVKYHCSHTFFFRLCWGGSTFILRRYVKLRLWLEAF